MPPLIDSPSLAAALHDPSLVILDCRFNLMEPEWGRQAFMQDHIPGAFFMDINQDLSSPVVKGVTGRHPLPDPEVILYTFRAAGIDVSKRVVVYDQSNGMYAARAWWLLHWLGHGHVQLLNGGYAAWQAASLPMDNTWPAPATSAWSAEPDMSMVVTKDYVAGMRNGLVDSRDRARYRGEVEPIDPVAGHIPGAVCLPFVENANPDGTWKLAGELRDRFADLPDNPVFYCGSGVSACNNILAYHLATGRMARLYGGSWSEWINYYPPAVGDEMT